INMVNDQVMPRGADDIEGGLFDSGRIAFQIASIGELVRYNETSGDRFEVGYMVQPPGPDGRRGSCIEGNQWMLNSQTAQVDGAWEVLKALTDKESNVWGAVNSTKIPARKSAYLDPKVNEVNPLYGLSVPIMEEWLEPFPMVWNLRYNEVFQVYAQELAFVVEGEKSWDEYANTIYDKVQEIVDEDRPPKAIG
ncbi:MAG: extracellular solute-binding protein, partial [Caldilineaceae bacterium]|nr:extracellular solute-binding protein [Caldilineaceae bacterium]